MALPRSAELASSEYLHGNVLLALEKPEPAVKRIVRARDIWCSAYGDKHRRVLEADALLAAVKADRDGGGRRGKGSGANVWAP
jgi:hypothetical protein